MKLASSFKKISARLRLKHILKLLPYATTLVLIACTSALLMFLYQYFYQTISQARVVSVLRNQLAISQINIPLYQEVLAKIQSKKVFDAAALTALKDPFQPLPRAAAGPGLEQANTPNP